MDKIYNKILCPTDFSNYSEVAFKKAVELASMFGSDLLIAHIITNTFSKLYGDSVIPPNELIKKVEEKVRAFAEENARGFSNEILVTTHEHIYQGIIDFVEEKKVDLIVMATRGITGARRIFLGSVAETVVRRAPCSVLVVRTQNMVNM